MTPPQVVPVRAILPKITTWFSLSRGPSRLYRWLINRKLNSDISSPLKKSNRSNGSKVMVIIVPYVFEAKKKTNSRLQNANSRLQNPNFRLKYLNYRLQNSDYGLSIIFIASQQIIQLHRKSIDLPSKSSWISSFSYFFEPTHHEKIILSRGQPWSIKYLNLKCFIDLFLKFERFAVCLLYFFGPPHQSIKYLKL